MAATQYMITTNGVDYGPRYTSKGRAVSEAETIGKVATERAHGDVVTVQTVKTAKVVWREIYYTHNEGLKFGPVHVEITGDTDVPACLTTADGPVETLTDDQWEIEHAAYVESLRSDPEVARMMADYDAHVASQPVVAYVGIRQGPAGYVAVEHVHAAGCADIARTEGKYKGGSDAYAYMSDMTIAEILSSNYGDIASDENETDTPEWWASIMDNANDNGRDGHSGIRILPCARKTIEDGTVCGMPLLTSGDVFRVNYVPAVDGPMTGQFDDYDYAQDEVKFAAMDAGTATMCTHGNVVAIQDGQTYVCGDCETGTVASETTEMVMGYDVPMNDTMSQPLMVDALLSVTVDGIKISLGWHTFTIPVGCETSIATLYGQARGEWNRATVADWDSIITVEDSETY